MAPPRRMRRRAVAAALGVAIAVSSAPRSADAASARATAAATPEPASRACGEYQCFSTAEAFWRSVPSPRPGQQATVSLRSRAVAARPGSPKMLVGLDNGPWSFWPAGDGAAQGRSGVIGGVPAGNVFNFRHWQYVDALYYYLHETVSVPPTQWVNAAHRNGVPVLGTVTADCDGCGPEAAKLFAAGNHRQTVRKLYDYAVAYGFDGWLVDVEGADFVLGPGLLQAVRELARTTLPNGEAMRVGLYHANELALGPSVPYFRAGAMWQSDYDTSTGGPAATYRTLTAARLQTERRRAFWASYVYAYQGPCGAGHRTTRSQIWNGNRTRATAPQCLDTARLFANQRAVVPPHRTQGTPDVYTSLALFAPIWPFVGNLPDKAAPARRARVHAADDALWVGAGVRYSGQSCRRSGTRNAVSALVSPRSVVGELPFVTSFDQGEGDTYAVAGTEVATIPWNNLSAQDVLPTWSCTVRGGLEATTVYATAGRGSAFDRGSALRLSGTAGEVELYDARIPVGTGVRPVLAFVSKVRRGPAPYLRVSYRDGSSDVVRAAPHRGGWRQTVRPLRARGRTITAISVGVGGRREARVASWLGQLRLYDAHADVTPKPIMIESPGPVVRWPTAASPVVTSWNVYRITAHCLHFLGPAFTDHYDVTRAMFPSNARARHYLVQPVSAAGSIPDVGRTCPRRA